MIATAAQCRKAIEMIGQRTTLIAESDLCLEAAAHLRVLTFADLERAPKGETQNARLIRITYAKAQAAMILARYVNATRKKAIRPEVKIGVGGLLDANGITICPIKKKGRAA